LTALISELATSPSSFSIINSAFAEDWVKKTSPKKRSDLQKLKFTEAGKFRFTAKIND
jgi:predicted transcriptional regulator